MEFEILCLDSNEAVKSRTVKTLLYALLANDTLFENPSMDETKGELNDNTKKSNYISHSFQLTKC